jgi:hypothetical protein
MSDSGNDGAGDEMSVLPFDDGSAGRIIRREWRDGRWFFCVVDVVAALTDSDAPRQYWYDMKRRIQDEVFRELSAKCLQLKMRSPLDGKKYAAAAAAAADTWAVYPATRTGEAAAHADAAPAAAIRGRILTMTGTLRPWPS